MVIKLHLVPILVIVGAWGMAGCTATSSPVISMTIDFPYGETRLLVQRDGEARLFYGELPQSRAVQHGTFDIDVLFKQLQPKIYKVLPTEARPLGQPYGMVTFEFNDGRSMDYLIYDGQYAADLFKTACQNSEGESVSFATIVDQKCADLLHTAP